MFCAIFNFNIVDWAGQHNRTTTLAEAAITATNSTYIKTAGDRELHRSTMAISIKSIFVHLARPLY
jgi:hypothetical protein